MGGNESEGGLLEMARDILMKDDNDREEEDGNEEKKKKRGLFQLEYGESGRTEVETREVLTEGGVVLASLRFRKVDGFAVGVDRGVGEDGSDENQNGGRAGGGGFRWTRRDHKGQEEEKRKEEQARDKRQPRRQSDGLPNRFDE